MNSLRQFLRDNRRLLLGLALSLAAFTLAPLLLRWIDPTAGAVDAGALHLLTLAGIRFFIATLLLWIAVHLDFQTLWRYLQSTTGLNFRADWLTIPPHHRIWATLATLLALLLIATLHVLG